MIKITGSTHSGRVRDHNEDAFLIDESRGLAVVADGMGGHASGEVASKIIVDTFSHVDRVSNDAGSSANLANTLLVAHTAIVAHAHAHSECKGMGATVVAVQADAQAYRIAWVGDSRIYHWHRKTGLQQVSRDHSYLEYLLASGEIEPEQARNHPQRNVVTQALGLNKPQPDSLSRAWQPGDRLLLCSDGLSDELDDAQIEALLVGNAEIEPAVAALIEAALNSGGRDNVSVVLLENRALENQALENQFAPTDEDSAQSSWQNRSWWSEWWPLFAGTGAALLFGAVAYFIF